MEGGIKKALSTELRNNVRGRLFYIIEKYKTIIRYYILAMNLKSRFLFEEREQDCNHLQPIDIKTVLKQDQ